MCWLCLWVLVARALGSVVVGVYAPASRVSVLGSVRTRATRREWRLEERESAPPLDALLFQQPRPQAVATAWRADDAGETRTQR